MLWADETRLGYELVRYNRDPEPVSITTTLTKVGYVACMEEIEDSVGEDGFHL